MDSQTGQPKFPIETWEAIFSNLTRVGDLYNVSITSRYIYQVVNPILYRRLYLDPNHYSIYTLSRLHIDPDLCRHVRQLTCFPPFPRIIPEHIIQESEALYHMLPIPLAKPPSLPSPWRIPWCPLGVPLPGSDVEQFIANTEIYTRPLLHFAPIFTNLTSLHIVADWVPANFLRCVAQARSLLTLEVRDSFIASNLQPWIPLSDLPLRELIVLRCTTRPNNADNQTAAHLCDAFLSRSPNLISLEIDSFLAWATGIVLSNLGSPASITNFSCSGMSNQDPDSTLLGHILLSLPAVTVLKLSRSPRDLSMRLPETALRNLTNVTGQMKSLLLFLGTRRPLQYLTITDRPFTNVGGMPWESQLIQFFEMLFHQGTMLRGLAFNIQHWSLEVLLCICQLWQGIRELKVQCTVGPGVDQDFQISFGPHFLPRLSSLEVLHIYSILSLYSYGSHHISAKGVINVIQYPLKLTDEEHEDIAEAPVHYRRWEKICPTLREVAFDREVWWRRVTTEPGGWTLMRDVIPALAQELH